MRGGASDNGFLKGFWRFLKPEKEFRFSAFSSYRSGFTLAEVLITLGIIGIVVAMTLPALIADHREKQTVNQVLAFYSKLSQATLQIINEEGDPGVWLREGAGRIYNSELLSEKYKKYMKVLTDCGRTGKSCVVPQYFRADKSTVDSGFSGSGSARYSMILQDGSAIVFFYELSNANPNNRNKKSYAKIYYDTNGVKPPNSFGYDMFQFDLTEDGIYAYSETEFKQHVYPTGWNDSYWVITHKNLDYQRCPDELKKGALGCKKKKK